MNRELFFDLARLMRFDRPVGTILLLWPTLWALVLASQGLPTIQLLMIFSFGVIVMRAAGCIVNDMIDREFDKQVTRTKNRPLATEKVSMFQAGMTLIILLSIALGLVCTLNFYTQMIAFIAFGLAVIYPFTKRFFPCPQLFLGVVWSCGMLMAFTAVNNELSSLAFMIYGAHLLLTVAYDSMYAMADKQDDLKLGLHSTAVLFGTHEAFYIALFQFAAFACLLLVGAAAQLAWPFWCSLIFVAGSMMYQQILIKDREPQKCLQAFLNNQWLGAVVLVGIIGSV